MNDAKKAPWALRNLLNAVPITASNDTKPRNGAGNGAGTVERLPVDVAAKAAKRANDAVVEAEGAVMLARQRLEEARTLYEGELMSAEIAYQGALEELDKRNRAFLRAGIEAGALQRVSDLNALVRSDGGAP